MDFGIFEDMAGVGCLSAERFLNHERTVATGFGATQILAVRPRRSPTPWAAAGLYAWASRMVTTVGRRRCCRPTARAPIGHEFLWLWPPGKAWNAAHAQARQRCHPAERVAGIDAAEPSVRHRMAHPGMMLGPTTCPGATRRRARAPGRAAALLRWPPSSRSRRSSRAAPVTEDWTARRHEDDRREPVPRGSHWGGRAGARRCSRSSERTQPQKRQCAVARMAGATSAIDGEPDPRPAARRARARSRLRARAGPGRSAEMDPAARGRRSPAPARARAGARREHGPRARARAQRARAQLWDQFERRSRRLRNARWADLPSELLVRIVCVHLGEELAATTAQARASICTMRLVSRGMCAVVDRFVGAQLHDIDESCARCFWSKGTGRRARRRAKLGARVRALGMHPEDVLRLSLRQRLIPKREQTADSMPPAALPNCPSMVPDWTAYLRRRAERETQHGARSIVVKPSASATAQFRAVVTSCARSTRRSTARATRKRRAAGRLAAGRAGRRRGGAGRARADARSGVCSVLYNFLPSKHPRASSSARCRRWPRRDARGAR